MTDVATLPERLRYIGAILSANRAKFAVPNHILAKVETLNEAADLIEAGQAHSLPGDVGLFDIEPTVGASSPEPSLRRMVRRYYNDHFNAVRAEELTERYIAALTPSALSDLQRLGQEYDERSERREGFAPCPTCRQYSHSIDDDALANAFMHFEAMAAHPVRGHPMGHIYDDATRDAAQVLVAAAKGASTPQRQEYDGEAVDDAVSRLRGWLAAGEQYARAGSTMRLDVFVSIALAQLDGTEPPTTERLGWAIDGIKAHVDDELLGDDLRTLLAALAHPAQATPSALSGDAGEGRTCPMDGDPCSNPSCSPGTCFPDSPGRNLPSHQGAGE